MMEIPSHVAIVMDGNRRWARDRNLSPEAGHWEGAEVVTGLVSKAKDLGIKVLTLYSFSTENWLRGPDEVASLMEIFASFLHSKRDLMVKEGVRLHTIGDPSVLPAVVQASLDETRQATQNGDQIDLVLAMNYGGRDELRRAVTSIAHSVQEGKISPAEITEELIAAELDTAPWGDPDLLIRTSGEFRVSNFLLWQISYAEIYFTKVLWPDFKKSDLVAAIEEYNRRSRRHGE